MHRRDLLPTLILVALSFSGMAAGTAFADDASHHTVQAGDTLYSLAKRYGTTVPALVASNGIGNDFKIRIGQVLIVPQAGATLTPAGSLDPGTGTAAPVASAPAAPASAKQAVVTSAVTPGRVATVLPVTDNNQYFSSGGSSSTIGRPAHGALTPIPTPAPAEPAKPNSAPAIRIQSTVQPTPTTGSEELSVQAAGRPTVGADSAVAPSRADASGAAGQAPGGQAWVIPVADGEMDLLARLVAAEAGNEPLQGQVGVAAVVVNRVRHPAFPKTISDVINEPGQFKSVELGRVAALAVTPTTLTAVQQALTGADPTGGALFFYNPAKSTALAFWSTRPVTAVIGNHTFAR